MNKYNFEVFTGESTKHDRALPANMTVGQLVERECSSHYIIQLKQLMRKEIRANGKAFSIAVDGDVFAIRRDK